jgi:hypothetical protein
VLIVVATTSYLPSNGFLSGKYGGLLTVGGMLPVGVHLIDQVKRLQKVEHLPVIYSQTSLKVFKSNVWAMAILITSLLGLSFLTLLTLP